MTIISGTLSATNNGQTIIQEHKLFALQMVIELDQSLKLNKVLFKIQNQFFRQCSIVTSMIIKMFTAYMINVSK